jgi:hypothetical protein
MSQMKARDHSAHCDVVCVCGWGGGGGLHGMSSVGPVGGELCSWQTQVGA